MNEIIDNLMQQHLDDPADEAIRGVLLDALLDAGRKRDWHKVRREWEPRAWLKAKGRRPWNYSAENGEVAIDGKWWFSGVLEDCGPDPEGFVYHHWIPKIIATVDRRNGFSVMMYESKESCIQDVVDKWNRLSRPTKERLWSWNPPA